ncbi:hypothetical protein KSP39_PZI016013 [Platanthera zijinensis]|uniref:Uncharacterized protein n=1 Tax=Platanthera zijinensis TaxID=2320716 RepID=A0AAP0G1Q1_9ASPA
MEIHLCAADEATLCSTLWKMLTSFQASASRLNTTPDKLLNSENFGLGSTSTGTGTGYDTYPVRRCIRRVSSTYRYRIRIRYGYAAFREVSVLHRLRHSASFSVGALPTRTTCVATTAVVSATAAAIVIATIIAATAAVVAATTVVAASVGSCSAGPCHATPIGRIATSSAGTCSTNPDRSILVAACRPSDLRVAAAHSPSNGPDKSIPEAAHFPDGTAASRRRRYALSRVVLEGGQGLAPCISTSNTPSTKQARNSRLLGTTPRLVFPSPSIPLALALFPPPKPSPATPIGDSSSFHPSQQRRLFLPPEIRLILLFILITIAHFLFREVNICDFSLPISVPPPQALPTSLKATPYSNLFLSTPPSLAANLPHPMEPPPTAQNFLDQSIYGILAPDPSFPPSILPPLAQILYQTLDPFPLARIYPYVVRNIYFRFDSTLHHRGQPPTLSPRHWFHLGSSYTHLRLQILQCLGLLFNLFRFGWKTSIHAVPKKHVNKPTFQTLMVVFLKEQFSTVNLIESSFDQSTVACNSKQAHDLVDVVKSENLIRKKYSSSTDMIYSLSDLTLGAKGNLQELQEGRRCQLILGGQGDSLYSYRTVLLDAHQNVGSFSYNCGVFIVPKPRACEWLFSSEDGQWQIVESSKSARLIMVLLLGSVQML